MIRDFYKHGLSQEDIKILSNFLDYQDVLFYVESKNKREGAAYTTRIGFNRKEAEELRLKASLFVAKIESILRNTDN